MKLKARVALFVFSFMITFLYMFMALRGYISQSFRGRHREVYLADDAVTFWIMFSTYLLLTIPGLYGMLQAVLNHPLFGGSLPEDASPEFQAKVFKKRLNSYIDEAETFYKYGDKLAAKLAC